MRVWIVSHINLRKFKKTEAGARLTSTDQSVPEQGLEHLVHLLLCLVPQGGAHIDHRRDVSAQRASRLEPRLLREVILSLEKLQRRSLQRDTNREGLS